MKQTQEFDGKNIDNAVEKACLALNISKKNLVYDVISSGSTGIFGIVGVKKAKIRVTLPEKKDNGGYSHTSSYDSDRAGVMSIVDEAFGKEIKQPDNLPSSENALFEHNEPDSEKNYVGTISDIVSPLEKESDNSSGNEKPSEDRIHSEGRNYSESRKHSDNRKNRSGDKAEADKVATDKPANSRSRRSRTSGRKPASEKPVAEKNSTNESAAVESLAEKNTAEGDTVAEKFVTKKQVRGKAAGAKPDTVKPYNRKSRTKKRDTWLRADGDDTLNEAMEAMDSVDAPLIPKTDEKTLHHKKRTLDNDNDPVDANGFVDDGDEYNSEPYDEFLNEDFHGGRGEHSESEEDDDAPYIKDDEEILEVFDERDDGYPPKYKGEVPVDVSDDAMRVGRETLQKMVALITDSAIVTSQSDEDRLLLKVEGGNSGVLIGRRGQTLEAMQYLTDKIINRYSESRVRLKVDIEGYMETRKANLKTLAYKMADKAKKTGKPATINQMTAQDRRIIHIALKDDTRVRTQSMGDGYYRRLVIFPKKSSFKRRKPLRK